MKLPLPETIKVTFAEEDRLTAGPFQSNGNCLLATALKRMGYNTTREISVFGKDVLIGDELYDFSLSWFLPSGLYDINNSPSKPPFYRKEVVGRTLELRKHNFKNTGTHFQL